ncbi:MAG: SDR family oxidoreductase, partial [Pseudomonadota bacterium]
MAKTTLCGITPLCFCAPNNAHTSGQIMLNSHIDLTGKTAIVTGASRGIGEAGARRLAAAGAKVALLARSEDDIARVASDIGDRAMAVPCDVADWSAVSAAFEHVSARFGGPHIVVNNAGLIDPIDRLENVDPAGWAQLIDVNVKGVFHCIRAALAPMKAAGGGTIINISSGAATSPLEGWSHYCASKAAVLMLTRCVHKEEGQNGIRCVGLSPGTVATYMQETIKSSAINPVSQLDWEAHITPQTAAEAIVWLTTDDASVYDGGDFSIKTPEGKAAVGLA